MRDKSHSDQVERWAKYVKNHPRSDWIKEIKPFIDSQVIMANRVYGKLANEKYDVEKINKIRGV